MRVDGDGTRDVSSVVLPAGTMIFSEHPQSVSAWTRTGGVATVASAATDWTTSHNRTPVPVATDSRAGRSAADVPLPTSLIHAIRVPTLPACLGWNWCVNDDGVSLVEKGGSRVEWPGGGRHVDRSGFGLVARVRDTSRLPFVFTIRTPGAECGLVEEAGGFVLVRAGERRPLPPVPIEAAGEIAGFAWIVPPIAGDLDGDGTDDFVRVDCSKGVVSVQCGLGAPTIPPPSTVKLGSPIIGAGLADLVDDARPELFVVRLPAMNPLQQLSILTEGRVLATVIAYRVDGGGVLRSTPALSRSVMLGLTVSVRDDERHGRFTTLALPTRRGVIVSRPAARAERLPWDGGGGETLGEVPDGTWSERVPPVIVGDSTFAVLETASEARLVRFAH